MDVRNCRSCGSMFNYIGGQPICAKCKQKLEDKFHEVKEYLEEHPAAGVAEVAEEMDVTAKQIKQWIKEERLSLSEATEDGITCESCGRPITSGRFCDKCKGKMVNEMISANKKPAPEPPPKEQKKGNRMRFIR